MTTTNQSHEPERMVALIQALKSLGGYAAALEMAANIQQEGLPLKEARELLTKESQWLADVPCQRCEGLAVTTVNTRHFGLEKLCEPCAVNVRRDGQEVPTSSDFPALWSAAPRSRTARIEREDAEWWFNQNRRDGNRD